MRYRVPFLSALLVALAFLSVNTANGGEQYARVSELQPELRQVLVRDAACHAQSASLASTSADSNPVDSKEDGALLDAPVSTQEIVVAGRDAGVIAAPHDACHCTNENCSTFVYLRADGSYKLALHDNFASLHPMKGMMHGLPSLSGKYQLNATQEETTVFNWNGKEYEPGLCATVTRRNNQKVPSISRHPCKVRVQK